MTGVLRADALRLPLADESVDLCVTSILRASNVGTIDPTTKCPRRRGNDPGTDRDPWEVPMVEQRTVSKSGLSWLVSPDGRRRLDPLPNWWRKVDRRGPDECWPWLKATDADGYGKFQVGKVGGGQEYVRSHRFGYEALVGPIPDGEVVCHRCDNPSCNNPAHWFTGTPKENNDDKVAKNRHAVPWGVPRSRMMQTHCHRGHELDGDNLWVNPKTGHRRCKTCARELSLRLYHEKGRAPRRIVTCVDCGERRAHRAHGRCTNCDAWWRRKGEPRVLGVAS